MMLWDVPSEVKRFFRPVTRTVSKSIRRALPGMVLAFLLPPHRRALKTIAGMVAGQRCHVGTISRRLDNPLWRTRDWYALLHAETLSRVDRWERRQAKGCRRRWFVVIDTTYHEEVVERVAFEAGAGAIPADPGLHGPELDLGPLPLLQAADRVPAVVLVLGRPDEHVGLAGGAQGLELEAERGGLADRDGKGPPDGGAGRGKGVGPGAVGAAGAGASALEVAGRAALQRDHHGRWVAEAR